MIVIRRAARPDATAMGDLYVRVWRDSFAGLFPTDVLLSLCPREAAIRWQSVLERPNARTATFVADDMRGGVMALGSCGVARDRAMGCDGEIYSVYVDSSHEGRGQGRGLMAQMFRFMLDAGQRSALMWTMTHGQGRFFCDALGGTEIARKTTRLCGMPVPLTAYAWEDLAATLEAWEDQGALPCVLDLSPRTAVDDDLPSTGSGPSESGRHS